MLAELESYSSTAAEVWHLCLSACMLVVMLQTLLRWYLHAGESGLTNQRFMVSSSIIVNL